MDQKTELTPLHAEQLENFLRFARLRRESHLKEVQAAFRETKESRLVDDSYTDKDVAGILDGLCNVVKADVQKELVYTSHTMALLLRSMFTQAETIMFDLHADTTQLENERLLKEIAAFEELSVQKEKDPKKKLGTINKVSDAALKHNIEKLTEKNQTIQDRFGKMQQQTIELLKDKTKLGEQLEQAKSELVRLQSKLEEKGEKVEINLDYTKKQADEKVNDTQKQLDQVKKELKEAQDQLAKKINETTQFQNMKKMIQKKNKDIKQLRDALIKYEPNLAAPVLDEE